MKLTLSVACCIQHRSRGRKGKRKSRGKERMLHFWKWLFSSQIVLRERRRKRKGQATFVFYRYDLIATAERRSERDCHQERAGLFSI